MKTALLQEPDLPKDVVREMRNFVSHSLFYPYLLRLSATVEELADVSFLWVREFFSFQTFKGTTGTHPSDYYRVTIGQLV